ncbi:MAG: LPXTG cell wall anchor domain-containing protein [Ruminococcaceae bacterium]|nr:LPXTG cell wall anchor domain-containing protein [Oscillospiraceae bacterium]
MSAFKKLFALLLTLTMVLSMAVPAMAMSGSVTPPTPANNDGMDGYQIRLTDKYDGHTYEAYQIFAGTYDPSSNILSDIKWGDGFDSTKAHVLLDALQKKENNPFGTAFADIDGQNMTADQIAAAIAKVMQGWNYDEPNVRNFAALLHEHTVSDSGKYEYTYLTGEHTDSDAGTEGENGEYIYTIPAQDDQGPAKSLEAGYYMIKDKDGSQNKNNDYYTRLLLHVVSDVSIKPKGDVPTVDKKVHHMITGTFEEYLDVAKTDTAFFKLTGTLPSNLDVYANYEYTFVDTMPKGLDVSTAVFGEEESSNYHAYPGIAEIMVERAAGVAPVQLYLTKDKSKADENDGVASPQRYNLLIATKEEDIQYDTENKPLTDVLITTVENADGTTTITIKFLDLKRSLPGLLASDKINIKYAVTVNNEALIGAANINEVELEFSNNPQGEGTGKTPPADSKVYLFELDVNKQDASTPAKPLAGAEFMLYQRIATETDGVYDYAYAVLKEYEDEKGEKDGSYIISDWILMDEPITEEWKDYNKYEEGDPNYAVKVSETAGQTTTENVLAIGDIGLDEDGNKVSVSPVGVALNKLVVVSEVDENDATKAVPIRIKGLDATIYYLQEINAPLSYNKLEEPVKVTISAEYNSDGNLTNMKVLANGTDGETNLGTGTGTIAITNNQGSTLPATGGIGTTLFYVAGGILVAVAVVMLVTKKRMADER